MYRIKDLQTNRYFAGGTIFKTKKEVCEQLISYHSVDCNMNIEEELLRKGKIEECLKNLMNFEWELEKI